MSGWFPLAYAIGTQYYVSAAGSDSNPGTVASPWATIAKVNAHAFNPGDGINFRGGDTFIGTIIVSYNTNVTSGGNKLLPIVLSSYGTGQATITGNASTGYNAAIAVDGVSGITIHNLTIRSNTAIQYGIYLTNNTSSVSDTTTVSNCDVASFSTEIFIASFTNAFNCGLFNNVNFLNNNLHGLLISSSDGSGISSQCCGVGPTSFVTNVTYRGNVVYNQGGVPLTNGAGSGIILLNVASSIAEFNLIYDNALNCNNCGGGYGIWTYQGDTITIQFNEVYGTSPTSAAGCDRGGIDVDGSSTNVYVQYNYSHGNAGPGITTYVGTQGGGNYGPVTLRYNISENDMLYVGDRTNGPIGGSGAGGSGTIYATYMYNNTIWNTNTGVSYPGGTSAPSMAYLNVNWGPGSLFVNNILAGNASDFMFFNGGNAPNLTISHNCYYYSGSFTPNIAAYYNGNIYTTLSSWQAVAVGGDPGSFTTNPSFTSGGSGGTLTWTPSTQNAALPGPGAYVLQAGSPCIGTGLDLTVSPYSLNVGTNDYFGNTIPHGVGTGYNIGADGGNP